MHDQIMETLKQCRYSVLSQGKDLERVFRLRYDCYRAEKSIPRNEHGIMSDLFDESLNCVHVAVELDDEIVAAVRLHLVSRITYRSPTIEVFPELLDTLRGGNTLLDPTRFVVRPDARKLRLPLHFIALRIPFLAAMFYDVDVALAPVRTEHTAFYLRYLGYDLFAAPRSYPMLKSPVCLLTAKFKEKKAEVLAKYPFFGPIASIPQSDINFPDLLGIYAASKQSTSRAA